MLKSIVFSLQVLCTERVSDLVAAVAAELQLAVVQLVPEEEAHRLCLAAGIVPLTSNGERVELP